MQLVTSPDNQKVSSAILFEDSFEQVLIEKWEPHAEVLLQHAGGMEALVIEGEFTMSSEVFTQHSWLRLPKMDRVSAIAGSSGARVWLKKGHLSTITIPT